MDKDEARGVGTHARSGHACGNGVLGTDDGGGGCERVGWCGVGIRLGKRTTSLWDMSRCEGVSKGDAEGEPPRGKLVPRRACGGEGEGKGTHEARSAGQAHTTYMQTHVRTQGSFAPSRLCIQSHGQAGTREDKETSSTYRRAPARVRDPAEGRVGLTNAAAVPSAARKVRTRMVLLGVERGGGGGRMKK